MSEKESAVTAEEQGVAILPGAFFEVTGTRAELEKIQRGIERTGDRLTAGDSMSADLWGEMLDEWWRIHDEAVEMRLQSLGRLGAAPRPRLQKERDERADQSRGGLLRSVRRSRGALGNR